MSFCAHVILELAQWIAIDTIYLYWSIYWFTQVRNKPYNVLIMFSPEGNFSLVPLDHMAVHKILIISIPFFYPICVLWYCILLKSPKDVLALKPYCRMFGVPNRPTRLKKLNCWRELIASNITLYEYRSSRWNSNTTYMCL